MTFTLEQSFYCSKATLAPNDRATVHVLQSLRTDDLSLPPAELAKIKRLINGDDTTAINTILNAPDDLERLKKEISESLWSLDQEQGRPMCTF